jgi:signal transduction histidine kinase
MGRKVVAWLCLGGIAASMPCCGQLTVTARGEESSGVLTNCLEVRELALGRGAKGLPVKVRGTVTYFDGARRQLFIQDGAAAVSIRTGNGRPGLENEILPGQNVEVEGVTSGGRLYCGIVSRGVRVIGAGKPPQPLQVNAGGLPGGDADSRWVRVRGWIPSVAKSGDRLSMDLVLGPGQSIGLLVLDSDVSSAGEFVGSVVEAQGVYNARFDSSGRPLGGRLLISDLSGLRKISAIPISSIREAGHPGSEALTPIRLRATVMTHSLGQYLVVRDRSGAVRIPFSKLTYYSPGSLVEVLACVAERAPDLTLTNITIKPVPAGIFSEEPTPEVRTPTRANTNLATLGQVSQVRRLSAQDASRGYPVHVTGVTTYWDTATYLYFVQDHSSGIYIDPSRLERQLAGGHGRRLEIEGFTGPGDYAPVIVAQKVTDLGEGGLPSPASPTFQKMMTGEYDSQWVVLRGVVRNQWGQTNATILALSTGDNVIKVSIRTPPSGAGGDQGRSLIDAGVEVQGVCSTIFDEHRRLQNVELQVPSWSQLTVKEQPPAEPFQLGVTPAGGLLEFHPGGRELHRVHMMGLVNLRQPDGTFYLQDASGGIQVDPSQSMGRVEVGSTVEVVGFPVITGRHPALQDAQVRQLRVRIPIEPADIKIESPLDDALNGTLVRMEGQVLRHFARGDEESLTLQVGQSITEAILRKSGQPELLGDIVPGSVIRLKGVYIARLDEEGGVQSFQVELRSREDVTVLSRPPRWTMRHLAYAGGALAGVLILALIWGAALRRQVKQRTRQLHDEVKQHERAEAQLKAEILERQRMQSEVGKTHQQLVTASREAGKAEVATSILHNVGNVLNSVNVSASLIAEQVRQSRVSHFARAAEMLADHASELPRFLTQDPKGQQLIPYLPRLAEHLTREQTAALHELESLRKNIEHIMEIVTVQQGYAKTSGVVEIVKAAELVEDALRINEESLMRHNVQVEKDYDPHVPNITLDKHKLLQILVNLISNAGSSCQESGRSDKRITARVTNGNERIRISIIDNGVGIPPENMTRIFTHGFTTRKDGHGFGLHSGALAAKEMGGTLLTESAGVGRGAAFTIELPLTLARQNVKLD